MTKEKRIKDKKPHQLKLASMSANWFGMDLIPNYSGKHHSQEVQKQRRLANKRAKSSSSKKYKTKWTD